MSVVRPPLLFACLVLAGCPGPSGDLDGDGFDAPEDCDDTDPAVRPDATEVCNNGIDDDCDGGAPTCRQTGTVTLGTGASGVVGGAGRARLGWSVRALGDLDADGFDDVIAGAPGDDSGGEDAGLALVLFGSPSGFDAARTVRLVGAAAGDAAGYAVGGGIDVTGDGVPDLLVGAPGAGVRDAAFADAGTGLAAGAVHVVAGPIGTDGVAERVLGGTGQFTIRGEAATDCLGRMFDVADGDGDGIGDLLVSSVCRGSYHYVHPHGNIAMLVDGPGAVHAFDGPIAQDLAAADARATWSGDADWDRLGTAVAWATDHDGDGRRDVAIGAPDYYGADWINLSATGRVLLFSGADLGPVATDAAIASASGGCCGSQRHEAVGTALAVADVDGDGVADLIAGAPRLDDFGVQGGAFALRGALSGTLDALTDGAWIAGPPQDAALPTRAGSSLAAGFDFDCDGALDFALGGPDDAGTGARGGGVRLHYGAIGDFVTLGERPEDSLHVLSDWDNEQLGAAVAAADVNGDGCDDLVVGAPEARDPALQAGAVRLLLGSGL